MPADHSDSFEIEKRLKSAAKELHNLASMVGLSRQVRAYDSDRRKNLLAKYMVPALRAGESATAAEQHARADAGYLAALDEQAKELETAEGLLAKNDALQTSWETARSLMAMQRQMLNTMPE